MNIFVATVLKSCVHIFNQQFPQPVFAFIVAAARATFVAVFIGKAL